MPVRTPGVLLRSAFLLLLMCVPAAANRDAFALGVPAMVRDINPGSGASAPVDLFPLGSKLVFFATDGVTGIEPWVSDGASGGTTLIKDVWAGASGGFNPGCPSCNAIALGGNVYFSGSNGTGSATLWKTDGTSVGTVNLFPGGSATDLTAVGSQVFFDGPGNSLWKSDGTVPGTVQAANNAYLTGADMADVNGVAYFPASDGFSGIELFKYDGISGGAVRVKDLAPGSNDSSPTYLTNFGGTLYFFATDGVIRGLYRSDGTAAGTVLVKELGMQGGSNIDPRQIIQMNGMLYLIASDPADGYELWKSDGTPAGTVMVKDIYPGSFGGMTGSALVAMGNAVYFVAADDVAGYELWKSYGTSAGTTIVKDIWPGLGGSSAGALANVNGTLFFHAQASYADGVQPYVSDGTEAGTMELASLDPADNSKAASFTGLNGSVFFAASDATHGVELWSVASPTAGVGPAGRDPASPLRLLQSQPNPARATTSIAYALAVAGRVVIRLYDAQGREVRTLEDGVRSAGFHRVAFDVKGLSAGVYFYRLATGGEVLERKLVLQR